MWARDQYHGQGGVVTTPSFEFGAGHWFGAAALAGLLWGGLDVLVMLGLGHHAGTFGANLATVLVMLMQPICLSLFVALGGWVAMWILLKLGVTKEDEHLVVFGKSIRFSHGLAFLCASMIAAQVFLYGYTSASHFGISMVGKHGIGRPMTTALWGLLAALLVTPLVATPLLMVLFKRSRRAIAVVWLALLGLQGLNLFQFLYEVSKATLIDVIFFLLVCTLLAWTGPVVYRLPGLKKLDKKAVAMALALVGVLGVAGTKVVTDRSLSHQAKILLYERNVLTSNVFQVLNRVVRAPKVALPCDDPSVPLELKPKIAAGPTQPIKGVVLIMIDALRGDQLRAKSSTNKPVMPRLDAYAKASTHFPNAYATGPGTIRASMSLFYGKYHKPAKMKLPTLMERLNEKGVKTFSLPTHKNVVPVTKFATIEDNSLVDQDRYRFLLTSEDVYNRSVKFLDQVSNTKAPFFQYIHYYDPHEYYVENAQFKYGSSQLDLYQSEVSYTDHWVGKYLDELKRRGLDKSTMVLIMSDHGDEFLEHRYVKHGYRLYDESVRILFILHDPRQKAQTIQSPTAIVDMSETVAQALGTTLGKQADGISLLGATDEALSERPVFLYWKGSVGVVYKRYKLLHHNHQGILEFYDLEADPKEMRNLADDQPKVMARMGCMIQTWKATLEK